MQKSSIISPESVANLTVSELVKLLADNGSESISPATVKSHIAAGAPINTDGTINLTAYAAWLVKNI